MRSRRRHGPPLTALPKRAYSAFHSPMRPGLPLLLLLGACTPPRPAPPTAARAGTPVDTHGPRPRAAQQMAPAAACAPHLDPEGWFSLGDPALPPPSVLRATPSTVALGFDE